MTNREILDKLCLSEKKPVRRPTQSEFGELMLRTHTCLLTGPASFRNMLANIHPLSHIEAAWTGQHGTVVDVIRDRFGIPACVKVIYEEGDSWGYDYISVNEITMYEPWNVVCPDDEYEWSAYIDDDSEPDEDEAEEGEIE